MASCNLVTGIGNFEKVECALDCGALDASGVSLLDAQSPDAGDSNPNDALVSSVFRKWARYEIPSAEDASSGRPVEYDFNADKLEILDRVTGLIWDMYPIEVDGLLQGDVYCRGRTPPGLWSLPTRVELMTLLYPESETFFPPALSAQTNVAKRGRYWTSSARKDENLRDLSYLIDFSNGEVVNLRATTTSTGGGFYVRCVHR